MAKNVSLAAILLGLCASVSLVQAQDAVLSELYGRGVHAYFSGRYEDAHKFLTQAVDKGTQDPRAYYFRGLAYSQLGRPDEAAADFNAGAELEAADTDQFYNVARALQRVQGDVRLTIEKQRNAARIAARELAEKRARARYDEFRKDEQRVLLAPSDSVEPVIPDAAATADVNDPFGARSSSAAPATPAPATPAVGTEPPAATADTSPAAGTMPPASADPFGAPATPAAADPFAPTTPGTAAKPATADPFGAPPTAPAGAGAAAAPAGSPPAAAGAGSKKGALGGLFRALKGTVPAPTLPGGLPGLPGGNDPFGDAPGGNDPFGAPPGNDPFGAPPAGNDPFAPPGGAAPRGNDPFGAPPGNSNPGNADPFGDKP